MLTKITGTPFVAALLLVFGMLMLGQVAVTLLPTVVAALAALVLAVRFGLLRVEVGLGAPRVAR